MSPFAKKEYFAGPQLPRK